MTELELVFIKDVRAGDYIPYFGDRVWKVDKPLPNGNVGLHTEHSGVFYLPAYEQFQTVERDGEPNDPEPVFKVVRGLDEDGRL
jgi:hypothetical protein